MDTPDKAAEIKAAPPAPDLKIYEIMETVRFMPRNEERKRNERARRRYQQSPSTRGNPKANRFKHSH